MFIVTESPVNIRAGEKTDGDVERKHYESFPDSGLL